MTKRENNHKQPDFILQLNYDEFHYLNSLFRNMIAPFMDMTKDGLKIIDDEHKETAQKGFDLYNSIALKMNKLSGYKP